MKDCLPNGNCLQYADDSTIYQHCRVKDLTLLAPTPQNGQTHSNNLMATGDEFFECVWPFCGAGA